MEDLVTEVVIVRWILIAILVVLVTLLLTVLGTLRGIGELVSDDTLEVSQFKAQAETYDSQGKYESLLAICERRLKKYKNDKWALYYIGIATLRLQDYAKSKAHFTRLRELDPQWADAVTDFLDQIDEQIRKNKPKSV